jgi:hypothetical protein
MIELVDLPAHYDKPRQEEIEISPNSNSLDLLQAVYRSNELPLSIRMRAAALALKHEVPTLGVSIVVNDADIAARLDKAIARSQQKLIEAKPNPETPINSPTNGKPTNENGGRPEPPQPDPLSRVYSNKRWPRRF